MFRKNYSSSSLSPKKRNREDNNQHSSASPVKKHNGTRLSSSEAPQKLSMGSSERQLQSLHLLSQAPHDRSSQVVIQSSSSLTPKKRRSSDTSEQRYRSPQTTFQSPHKSSPKISQELQERRTRRDSREREWRHNMGPAGTGFILSAEQQYYRDQREQHLQRRAASMSPMRKKYSQNPIIQTREASLIRERLTRSQDMYRNDKEEARIARAAIQQERNEKAWHRAELEYLRNREAARIQRIAEVNVSNWLHNSVHIPDNTDQRRVLNDEEEVVPSNFLMRELSAALRQAERQLSISPARRTQRSSEDVATGINDNRRGREITDRRTQVSGAMRLAMRDLSPPITAHRRLEEEEERSGIRENIIRIERTTERRSIITSDAQNDERNNVEREHKRRNERTSERRINRISDTQDDEENNVERANRYSRQRSNAFSIRQRYDVDTNTKHNHDKPTTRPRVSEVREDEEGYAVPTSVSAASPSTTHRRLSRHENIENISLDKSPVTRQRKTHQGEKHVIVQRPVVAHGDLNPPRVEREHSILFPPTPNQRRHTSDIAAEESNSSRIQTTPGMNILDDSGNSEVYYTPQSHIKSHISRASSSSAIRTPMITRSIGQPDLRLRDTDFHEDILNTSASFELKFAQVRDRIRNFDPKLRVDFRPPLYSEFEDRRQTMPSHDELARKQEDDISTRRHSSAFMNRKDDRSSSESNISENTLTQLNISKKLMNRSKVAVEEETKTAEEESDRSININHRSPRKQADKSEEITRADLYGASIRAQLDHGETLDRLSRHLDAVDIMQKMLKDAERRRSSIAEMPAKTKDLSDSIGDVLDGIILQDTTLPIRTNIQSTPPVARRETIKISSKDKNEDKNKPSNISKELDEQRKRKELASKAEHYLRYVFRYYKILTTFCSVSAKENPEDRNAWKSIASQLKKRDKDMIVEAGADVKALQHKDIPVDVATLLLDQKIDRITQLTKKNLEELREISVENTARSQSTARSGQSNTGERYDTPVESISAKSNRGEDVDRAPAGNDVIFETERLNLLDEQLKRRSILIERRIEESTNSQPPTVIPSLENSIDMTNSHEKNDELNATVHVDMEKLDFSQISSDSPGISFSSQHMVKEVHPVEADSDHSKLLAKATVPRDDRDIGDRTLETAEVLSSMSTFMSEQERTTIQEQKKPRDIITEQDVRRKTEEKFETNDEALSSNVSSKEMDVEKRNCILSQDDGEMKSDVILVDEADSTEKINKDDSQEEGDSEQMSTSLSNLSDLSQSTTKTIVASDSAFPSIVPSIQQEVSIADKNVSEESSRSSQHSSKKSSEELNTALISLSGRRSVGRISLGFNDTLEDSFAQFMDKPQPKSARHTENVSARSNSPRTPRLASPTDRYVTKMPSPTGSISARSTATNRYQVNDSFSILAADESLRRDSIPASNTATLNIFSNKSKDVNTDASLPKNCDDSQGTKDVGNKNYELPSCTAGFNISIDDESFLLPSRNKGEKKVSSDEKMNNIVMEDEFVPTPKDESSMVDETLLWEVKEPKSMFTDEQREQMAALIREQIALERTKGTGLPSLVADTPRKEQLEAPSSSEELSEEDVEQVYKILTDTTRLPEWILKQMSVLCSYLWDLYKIDGYMDENWIWDKDIPQSVDDHLYIHDERSNRIYRAAREQVWLTIVEFGALMYIKEEWKHEGNVEKVGPKAATLDEFIKAAFAYWERKNAEHVPQSRLLRLGFEIDLDEATSEAENLFCYTTFSSNIHERLTQKLYLELKAKAEDKKRNLSSLEKSGTEQSQSAILSDEFSNSSSLQGRPSLANSSGTRRNSLISGLTRSPVKVAASPKKSMFLTLHHR